MGATADKPHAYVPIRKRIGVQCGVVMAMLDND